MVSRKLNVGVIISPGIKTGGGYQYEYMVLDILKKYHNLYGYKVRGKG